MSSRLGRWRSTWCVSLVKSLPSYKALKPLIPTFCLVVVLTYGLADRLRNFVVGIFIPQYHFPFPVALSFAQVLVSLLFMNIIHALGIFTLKPCSRHLGERLLLPSICHSVQSVLAMWAKARSCSAGLFLFTVPLLPLTTLILCLALKLGSPALIHSSSLISIFSGIVTVITASKNISGLEPLECIYAPLALILHSAALIGLAKVFKGERHRHPDTQASVFDIYYAQLVNQAWLLGLLWLLHPDNPWHVLSQSSWRNLLFHGYFFAIILLGMVLNFMVGMSALCVSPIAASLLFAARQIIQPLFQLL